MEPSKSKKPALPPLATNIPLEEHGRRSVFARSNSPDSNIKPERPAGVPPLFPDENIAPVFRHSGGLTIAHAKGKSIEELPTTTQKPEARSTYYEEYFSSRGSHNSPRERIIQDSVVIAELTTSAKVTNIGMLMMDFSRHLAMIYQRPEAAILLTINPDAALSFGNISLPGYLLKIYALPTVIAPTINARSTEMISNELQDQLGINPELGVIVFMQIPHENLATNAITAGNELSRMERSEQGSSPNLFRSIGRSFSRRRLKTSSGGTSGPLSPPSGFTASPSAGRTPISASDDIAAVERRHQIGVKESVQSFVRRRLRDRHAGSSKDEEEESPKVETEAVKPKRERVRFEDEDQRGP